MLLELPILQMEKQRVCDLLNTTSLSKYDRCTCPTVLVIFLHQRGGTEYIFLWIDPSIPNIVPENKT